MITLFKLRFTAHWITRKTFFLFRRCCCAGSSWNGVNFFAATHRVLCFRFMTRTVQVTDQCFGCGWTVLGQCQGFLFVLLPPPPPALSGLGLGKRLGGDIARTADPNWPKGYSVQYHVALSIKTGLPEEEGEGVLFSKVAFAQRLLDISPLVGVVDWLPVHHLNFFPLHFLNWLCLDSWVLLWLFLFSPLSCCRGSEQTTVCVLGCWPGSTHHRWTQA